MVNVERGLFDINRYREHPKRLYWFPRIRTSVEQGNNYGGLSVTWLRGHLVDHTSGMSGNAIYRAYYENYTLNHVQASIFYGRTFLLMVDWHFGVNCDFHKVGGISIDYMLIGTLICLYTVTEKFTKCLTDL